MLTPTSEPVRHRGRLTLAVTTTMVLLSCVRGDAAMTYRVWTGGSSTPPYDTWAKAASSIQTAVDAASSGDTVLVTNGTYTTAIDPSQVVTIDKGITLRSANGAQATVIDAGNVSGRRCVTLGTSAGAATVEGFTLTRGYITSAAGSAGAGIRIEAGTVRDCTITNNYAASNGSGGGIYMTGGTVTNCLVAHNRSHLYAGGVYVNGGGVLHSSTVRNNSCGINSAYDGGGLLMINGGSVVSCRIHGNTAGMAGDGGGIELRAGVLRNCLVYGNSGGYSGGIYNNGGAVENCVSWGNRSLLAGSGTGLKVNSGTVVNSIIYGNRPGSVYDLDRGACPNVEILGGSVTYSCATPLLPGVGNIAADPLFANPAAADFSLTPGSPCVDAGTNLAQVTSDIDGLARPVDGDGDASADTDMGVHEATDAGVGPLRCGFTLSTNEGVNSVEIELTAAAAGSDTSLSWYGWDFDGDGTVDVSGGDKSVVTNTFGPGLYDVSLTVTNSSAQGATCTIADSVRVSPSVSYVSLGGTALAPYTNWATAATDLQTAIDAAAGGTEVLVSNGTYALSSEVQLAKNLRVTGVNGADAVLLNRSSGYMRILFMSAPGAVMDGITITNGAITSANYILGAGVYLLSGSLQNCHIVKNKATSNADGGGIYMIDGLVSNCVVSGNGAWFKGNGIRMSGGTVRECLIVDNVLDGNNNKGGGVYMDGGVLLNCVLRDNECDPAGGYGGGIYMNSGAPRVLNCTVAHNNSGKDGGGIYRNSGSISNTIVYLNTEAGSTVDNYFGDAGAIAYSCASELTTGVDGNTSTDPAFADAAARDYALQGSSPCLDTGVNLPEVTIDYAGTVRPLDGDGTAGAQYDMGAFEAPDATLGPLAVDFSVSDSAGVGPHQVVFSALPSGGDTNIVWYGWDFGNDGLYDEAGAALPTVTNTYGPGLYSVSLLVSNASGQAALQTKTDEIHVAPSTLYVAVNGSHTVPYTNWATAATNLLDAVDFALGGSEILVSNGLYEVTNTVTLSDGIALRGVSGAAMTIIRRWRPGAGEYRVAYLAHADAVIEGVTLSNGWASVFNGGGVLITGGTLRDCIVRKCETSNNRHGGGLSMTDGLVEGCTVRDCYAHLNGGGIEMSGGRVTRSRVHGNLCGKNSAYDGAGVYISGGQIDNSLVYDNSTAAGGSGGGVEQAGGSVVNCTIAHNNCGTGGGGGIHRTAGSITNCIVSHNTQGGSSADDFSGAEGALAYSCASDITAGPNGNVAAAPEFVDAGNRDYELQLSSPCIDAGTNVAAITNDFAGSARPQDGDGDSTATHDMGAYETVDAGSGPLRVDFSTPSVQGVTSIESVFTAQPAGADINITWYGWDFNYDGNPDASGADLGIVTNVFTPGYHTVSLTVSNGSAESATQTKAHYIQVAPPILYVSPDGSHTVPFADWSTAATTLQAAVDLALDTSEIVVSNGTYAITEQLVLNEALYLHSLHGAPSTIVTRAGGTTRIVSISHSNAVLDGLTLSNGYMTADSGAGVRMSQGTVRHCTIAANSALNNMHGGGAYVTGGLLENCTITGNSAWMNGGGVYLGGDGLVRNCVIRDNRSALNAGFYGGGAYVANGTLRGCVVDGNRSGVGGAGVAILAGTAANCTITGNEALNGTEGAGLLVSGGAVTNCIVVDNKGTAGIDDVNTTIAPVWFSCSPDLLNSANANITGDPLFVAPGSGYGDTHVPGDYRLQIMSPCLNTGANLDWMTGATDLDGNPRILNKLADMGAYETFLPPRGTVLMVR